MGVGGALSWGHDTREGGAAFPPRPEVRGFDAANLMNGTGLVRRPSSRLAEGIVTHVSRTSVDVGVARAQHEAYADALAASGWMVQQGCVTCLSVLLPAR
jgi:hypothetical protein